MTSSSIRRLTGQDKEGFVEHLQSMQADVKAEILLVSRCEEFGKVYVRLTAQSGLEERKTEGVYQSTWILKRGEWRLDRIEPVDPDDGMEPYPCGR